MLQRCSGGSFHKGSSPSTDKWVFSAFAGSSASTGSWVFSTPPNCSSSCASNVLAEEAIYNNINNEFIKVAQKVI
jgi:hypothetical protein